jgi:hypothetical protein
MATFTQSTFLKYDDYMTPKSAWENIKDLIPKNKTIWEPFYGDGKSAEYLKELGFKVIHEPNIDFFENNKGDIVISNPPFSKSEKVLKKLKEINKSFILILPVSKMNTQYFRKLFKDDKDLKIIIPKSRIHFNKIVNGKTPDKIKKSCNFDCNYYCYKIDTLPNQINWL